MTTEIRCQGCGEKLIPIPVKGRAAIYPSQCRNGHPTGWKPTTQIAAVRER